MLTYFSVAHRLVICRTGKQNKGGLRWILYYAPSAKRDNRAIFGATSRLTPQGKRVRIVSIPQRCAHMLEELTTRDR